MRKLHFINSQILVSDPEDGIDIILYTLCVKCEFVSVINELLFSQGTENKQCQNYKPDLQVTTVNRPVKTSRAGLVQCSRSAM